ncbi:hypothetical protein D3C75_333320 [compost metagenome]
MKLIIAESSRAAAKWARKNRICVRDYRFISSIEGLFGIHPSRCQAIMLRRDAKIELELKRKGVAIYVEKSS